MFPNPTTSELHIISNQIIEELKINIIDAAGKIVSEHRLITDEFIGKINFDLSNGIYFINFLNSSIEQITKKFVIVI